MFSAADVPAASCPTSFEGRYGRIIYRVRAVIDTPRFVTDYSTEKPFYMLNLLNLNQVPDIWVSGADGLSCDLLPHA